MNFRSDLLKERRQAKGLSIPELQCRLTLAGCDVSTRAIYQLEHGPVQNPSAKLLVTLSEVLGVTPSYFYRDDVAATTEAGR